MPGERETRGDSLSRTSGQARTAAGGKITTRPADGGTSRRPKATSLGRRPGLACLASLGEAGPALRYGQRLPPKVESRRVFDNLTEISEYITSRGRAGEKSLSLVLAGRALAVYGIRTVHPPQVSASR